MDDNTYRLYLNALQAMLAISRVVDLDATERQIKRSGSREDLDLVQAARQFREQLGWYEL